VNPVTESRSRIQAVVFDVGETLVDETRAWSYEAKRAGVTPLTLFAALGALIEQGNDHREVWALLGVEPPTRPLPLEPGDFYPDALPCLRDVAAAGLRVGIAGNQPEAAEEMLRSLDAPLSLVASSSRWGVEKPSPAFFEQVCAEMAVEPAGVAYVGDRVDNDVLPAKAAGMFAVLVRRGPWGYLGARRPEAATADLRLDDLTSLVPRILAARWAASCRGAAT
jgi:FMN phosphatase YigB (HAD superfamily)